MAREVVLQVWCDQCIDGPVLNDDEAVHVEITIDNPKSNWEMDLCQKHADEMLSEARPDGKPKTAKQEGNHPCEACDFKAKTEGGLALHIKRKHTPEGKPENE